MTAIPKQKMSVDEFLAWSDRTPGRYELVDGVVHKMQSERVRHADRKFAIQSALRSAIRAAGLPCYMLPDGMTVRIDTYTAYEPDALVYCGDRLDDDDVEVPNPLVIIEVLSPSTGATDTGRKLIDYFKLASVMHYIIVNPSQPPIVHHARQGNGSLLTQLLATGTLTLNPPGITLDIQHFFERD